MTSLSEHSVFLAAGLDKKSIGDEEIDKVSSIELTIWTRHFVSAHKIVTKILE